MRSFIFKAWFSFYACCFRSCFAFRKFPLLLSHGRPLYLGTFLSCLRCVFNSTWHCNSQVRSINSFVNRSSAMRSLGTLLLWTVSKFISELTKACMSALNVAVWLAFSIRSIQTYRKCLKCMNLSKRFWSCSWALSVIFCIESLFLIWMGVPLMRTVNALE